MATSAEALCKYNAPEFCKFTEAVLEMKFDEEPKYAALISLFEPILAGCVHKPNCEDSAIKAKPPLLVLVHHSPGFFVLAALISLLGPTLADCVNKPTCSDSANKATPFDKYYTAGLAFKQCFKFTITARGTV